MGFNMSDKKQFLLVVCVFALVAIIVGWVYIGSNNEVDNVTNFTIVDGKIESYDAHESIVELPYIYKLDSNGRAIFGYDKKVEVLGAKAFSESNIINRLAISININIIEDNAFDNLEDLEILILRGSNPPVISASEIQSLTNLQTIYIYKDYKQNYLEDSVWSLFADKIEII